MGPSSANEGQGGEGRRDCPAQHEIAAFALDALPGNRRREMADHLASCGSCRTRLAQVEALLVEPDAGEAEPLPDDAEAAERIRFVLDAEASEYYTHFLEEFLNAGSRLLRVPWWAVHLLLYVVQWCAVLALIDIRAWFPGGGAVTLTLLMTAEWLFTAFMLRRIRECRASGLRLAAALPSPRLRAAWLTHYLGPLFGGWAASPASDPGRAAWIRPWHVTAALMVVLYASVLMTAIWGVPIASPNAETPNLDLIMAFILTAYAQLAKCAMLAAIVAHFWFLYGLVSVADGRRFPGLGGAFRRTTVYANARAISVMMSVVLGVSVGIWMLGDSLAYGPGRLFWTYILSVELVALFVVQYAIVNNARLRSFFRVPGQLYADLRASFAEGAGIGPSAGVAYRPADMIAVALSSAAPVILGFVGLALRPYLGA